MRPILQKDIPPRAAAVIVALVLLASAVTGSELRDGFTVADPVTAPAKVSKRSAASPDERPASTGIDLDLNKLRRPVKEGKVNDLLLASVIAPPPPRAPVSPPVAPVRVDPPPPPKPVAPALPFTYLGRMIDDDRMTVFVSRNNIPHSVSVGDSIDAIYKLDSVTDGSIVFVYLPLDEKQTLTITSPN